MSIRSALVFSALAAFTLPHTANAVEINGSIGSGEWTDTVIGQNDGFKLGVQSDADNLYILGNATNDTTDGTDNSTGFDVFDVNIGLDGNTAPWRYRIRTKNNFFGSGPLTNLDGDWKGDTARGDDSARQTAGSSEPSNLQPFGVPSDVEWSVDDTDGNRVHEIAIPWSRLLDGQNGWEEGPLTLRIGGFALQNGQGGPLLSEPDFNDQDNYYVYETASAGQVADVPVSGTLGLLLGGLGMIGLGVSIRRTI